MTRSPRNPIFVIFITVFIDMLSFGLVIPDLQIRAKTFGADGWLLGAVLAVFSLATLVSAPILGRLSDKIGRRPVLFFGAAMNAVSFIVYAFAHSLPLMFLSRIIGGIGSANLSAAYAYVADSTNPEERAKNMGFIGAAFGMGFIFGPTLGGILAKSGGNFLLGMVAATIAAANCYWILTELKETRTPGNETSKATVFTISALTTAITSPGIAVLIGLFFVYNYGFSNMESTFVLLSNEHFGLDEMGAGLVLGFVGVMIGITQGLLVGPIQKAIGERNMVRIGLLLVAPSLAMIPFLPSWHYVLLGSMGLCFGSGIATPALQTLISRSAPANVQGGIFGVTQALGAFARILGPLTGQTAYKVWYPLPYLIAGGLVLLSVILALFFLPAPSDPDATLANETPLP